MQTGANNSEILTVKEPKIKREKIKKPKTLAPRLYPQDDSSPKLRSALRNGYTQARWILNPDYHAEKDDGICEALANNVFSIEELLTGLNYDAPIFETSHVGCLCSLEVSNPDNPELQPYTINYGGRWADFHIGNIKYAIKGECNHE